MRKFGWIIVLAAVGGCSKPQSILGDWSMNAPFGTLMVAFKSDGTYAGTLKGPAMNGDVKGTYKVTGDALEMNPPELSMANGQIVRPPGGLMRMRMTWKDDRSIELFNGKQTFTMTRTQ